MQAENLVVIKHVTPWRGVAGQLWRRTSWAATRRLARETVLRREWLATTAAWAWPFKWGWLVAWGLAMGLVLLVHVLTAAVAPTTWRDVLTLVLSNLTVAVYAVRARAPIAAALDGARAFKEAGSVALRHGKLDMSVSQYDLGATSASELRAMGWKLNARALRLGRELQAACRNNAAIVLLKQKEWDKAEEACSQALYSLGADGEPLSRAKALYRRAVARLKQGQMTTARADLRAAHALQPTDREVEGLLLLLLHGEERRREGVRRTEEEAEVEQTEAALAAAARRAEALRAALDPSQVAAAALFGQFAPAEAAEAAEAVKAVKAEAAPAAAAAAAPLAVPATALAAASAATEAVAVPRAHPAPPPSAAPGSGVELKFSWAKAWLEENTRRLACQAPPALSPSRPLALSRARSPSPSPSLSPSLSPHPHKKPCQDEDGAMVVICTLKAISGEASVTAAAGPRAKRTRAFDLAFELEWQARACDTHFSGLLLFSEVR
jgi:hypothetical protein